MQEDCLPDGSVGKESSCNAEDLGSIPGLGRSLGERKGYPLQYSGLENSMDSIVHGVSKSQTRLSSFCFLSFSELLGKPQDWRLPEMPVLAEPKTSLSIQELPVNAWSLTSLLPEPVTSRDGWRAPSPWRGGSLPRTPLLSGRVWGKSTLRAAS